MVFIRLFKQLSSNFRGSKSRKFGMGCQGKVFAVEKNWDYRVCSLDFLGSITNKECLIRIGVIFIYLVYLICFNMYENMFLDRNILPFFFSYVNWGGGLEPQY